MEKEFHGIIPPAVTPLTAESMLDTPGTERLLNKMISGGIHGVFILGTTGEGPALRRDVQCAMIRETVRIVNGRIPVLVGISSPAFGESVELAAVAGRNGASAVVAAPPCYFTLGEAELLNYYRVLAKEITLPLFVYNMPSMTKTYMTPGMIEALAEIPNIRGYKDSSGNMPDFHQVILSLGEREDFSIFVGPEELLGESVLFGADGGVCGGANIDPQLFVRMYHAAIKGDVQLMRQLQKKIYQQRQLYALGRFQSSMIKGVKSALKQQGICGDFPACPFNHFDQPEAQGVAEVLKKLQQEA